MARFGLSASLWMIALVGASSVLAGCKVVSIAEDRAMGERTAAGFDAGRYAEGLWASQAVPYWTDKAQPLAAIVGAARSDLDVVGARHGRRAGDGSPWTFVVEGEGVVTALDAGRRGRATIAVPGSVESVILQIGPVVSGSALRDSLPFVQFDDFANQLVYADVSHALTDQALDAVRTATPGLKVGDRLSFSGVLVAADAAAPLVVTPYRLERAAPGAAS